MLAILCLLLFSDFKDDVEGLGINILGHSAAYDGRLFISYFPPHVPAFSAVIIDLKAQKVTKIEDGRIRGILPYVILMRDGYALLTRSDALHSVIYTLDLAGNFKDMGRLSEFAGWDEQLKRENFTTDAPGLGLLTLRKGPTLVLAKVNFVERTIETLVRQQVKEQFTYCFFRQGDAYYRVCSETEQIIRYENLNDKGTTIRGAREVYRTPKNKIWAKAAGPYVSLLEQPLANNDDWVIHWRQVYDEGGNLLGETVPRNITLKNGGIEESYQAVLASYKEMQLVFDWGSKYISIR